MAGEWISPSLQTVDEWEKNSMVKKRPIPPLPTTAYTAKWAKKRKTEEEKKLTKKDSRAREKTRVFLGDAFVHWRELREVKGLRTDEELAVLLLDSYMNDKDSSTSTPTSAPLVSSIYAGSHSDRPVCVCGVHLQVNTSSPAPTSTISIKQEPQEVEVKEEQLI